VATVQIQVPGGGGYPLISVFCYPFDQFRHSSCASRDRDFKTVTCIKFRPKSTPNSSEIGAGAGLPL
jgi:hypothetical protein